MDEVAVPVAQVVAWLSRVTAAEAGRLLVGCELDDDTGADATLITAVDPARQIATLCDGRRVPLERVRTGNVIDPRPGGPLRAAVEAMRTPGELRERAERLELGRAGIDADRLGSADNVRAVLVVLRGMAAGRPPARDQRHAFYRAMSAGGDRALARSGARILADLMQRFAGAPDDVRWQLAVLLRSSGQLREAVAASEVLHSGRITDATDRKLLATTRAGTLLDLFDAARDPALLTAADRALKIAYALGPNDEEVRSAYGRLNRLRDRSS